MTLSSRETLSTGVPSEIEISVSPLKYQLKSASPPSPKPFSGPSFGPATKPSSDTVMLKTTFPMLFSFSSFSILAERFSLVMVFLLISKSIARCVPEIVVSG
jgi:hypothetical protein